MEDSKYEVERLTNLKSGTNETMSTKFEINEQMDDNSSISAESVINTAQTFSGDCVNKVDCEDSKIEIGKFKFVDANWKKNEPANSNTANKDIEEMPLKYEIKDEPLDSSSILTYCTDDTGEIFCGDSKTDIDHSLGNLTDLRSSDAGDCFVESTRQIHTGEKPYQCNVNNKSFTTTTVLNIHKLEHTDEKPYEFDGNEKCFVKSDKLNTNNINHLGEKPYQCDVCSKTFITSNNLRVHKRIHTGEKPYQCDVCKKCFTQSTNLIRHKRIIHTGEKPYKCDVCDKCFSTSGNLFSHCKIHTVDKPYQCSVCNKRFFAPAALIHAGEKSLNCDDCNKSNFTSKDLKFYKRIHTDEKPCNWEVGSAANFNFGTNRKMSDDNTVETLSGNGGDEISFEDSKIEIGKFKFVGVIDENWKKNEPASLNSANKDVEKMSLKYEIKDEPMDSSLIPTNCLNDTVNNSEISCKDSKIDIGQSSGNSAVLRSSEVEGYFERSEKRRSKKCFSQSTSSYKHKRIRTDEKPHQCDVCNKRFIAMKDLKVHKRIHTGEKPYKCDVCNKCFTTSGSFNSHNMIHTGEKPHQCDVCKKRFIEAKNLKVHKRIHTGEKPYKCDVCEKCFTQLINLYTHRRVHTGEKPHQCDVCSKRFTTSKDLKVHKRIHTGEKPYKCDVCKKCFTRLSSLNTHNMIHTGEKPHQCDVCDMRFIEAKNLNRHKRIHTGEKPYKCDFCEKCYTSSNNLKSHRRIHTGDK